MTTHVKFKLAKLLKEKGFDIKCENFYNKGSGFKLQSDPIIRTGKDIFYEAPTIAEVVMWLYEKHRIWISVQPRNEEFWRYDIYTEKVQSTRCYKLAQHKSPTEAYEAAIEYCLNNLI